MAEAQLEDLAWLGLDWDEGPEDGPHAPYRQSERSDLYEEALTRLAADGHLFPCRLSRKDLRELASAPHGKEGQAPYPRSLRPQVLEEGWFETLRRSDRPDAAIRFRAGEDLVSFTDHVQGKMKQWVDRAVGDFVLKRRDGLYAYQLAVVVDDILMDVTEVVRGEDLLSSTGRQIQLIRALCGRVPEYAHVPLVVNDKGDKLSKRDAGLDLRSLRAAGVSPEQFAGYLGYSLGLLPEARACTVRDLIPHFKWERIPFRQWPLPDDLPELLVGIR